jgi:hypothetical protein
MESWSFLTNHARVLLRIAQDPGARLRDIAATLGITERSAYGIVTDLTRAGYVVKEKDGRRNRYQIQAHLPLPGPGSREPTVGEVVALFAAQGRLVTGPRASEPTWLNLGPPPPSTPRVQHRGVLSRCALYPATHSPSRSGWTPVFWRLAHAPNGISAARPEAMCGDHLPRCRAVP